MPIVKNGLVTYYNAKQGFDGETWQDLTGNGRDLNVEGATLDADGVYFDGVDDHCRSDWDTFAPMTDYTVEVALKKHAQSRTMYILHAYANSGIDARELSANSSEQLRINDGLSSVSSSYVIPSDTLTIITIKRIDDLNHAIYQDGVYQTTLTTNQYVHGFWGTWLIGYNGGSTYYAGHIAFVRMYDRALSDAEIEQNAAVGLDIGLDDDEFISINYDTLQTIYAEQRQDVPTEQAIYAEESSPTPLNVRIYDDIDLNLSTTQCIYTSITDNTATLQGVYSDGMQRADTLQQVYVPFEADYPLRIVIIDPSDYYRQQVYIDVQIKRQLITNAEITRMREIEVRI